MNFKIHRGTREIGGSCIEVWTDTTRIILDFGMPLVDKDGDEFDFSKYKDLSSHQLVEKGVLPDISGLYDSNSVDGVIISHAHQDHYGLVNYIHPEVNYYLGAATHTLLKLNALFTPQDIQLKHTTYFKSYVPFTIGDITITPYLNDHSALTRIHS